MPSPYTARTALLMATAAAAGLPGFESRAAELLGLGDLPGGEFFSQALAVSADGRVVVGQSHSATGREAFRWTRTEGLHGLGFFPGGAYSKATAVSADGAVIVGAAATDTRLEAFRWRRGEGLRPLGRLYPEPFWSSHANAVSADGGVIVGWSQTEVGIEAFRWTDQLGMVALGIGSSNPYASSEARSVSADGSVAVGTSGPPHPTHQAVLWNTAQEITHLGDLPGSNLYSQAQAVSADGRVVVGRGNGSAGPQAFRWVAETGMRPLEHGPELAETLAFAVSADGRIVAGTANFSTRPTAVLWDAAGAVMTLAALLQAQGVEVGDWNLMAATGMSADGRVIVGTARNPAGLPEAFVATLDRAPENTAP